MNHIKGILKCAFSAFLFTALIALFIAPTFYMTTAWGIYGIFASAFWCFFLIITIIYFIEGGFE